MELHENLKSLGEKKTSYSYDKPDAGLLEAFPNPFALPERNPCGAVGTIHIVCPEFTCLCPMTGQPDFATIVIDYQPDKLCVESKSFKLYLGSFRMFGEFHEAGVNRICNDLVALLEPHSLVVRGEFTPRGGIPFWPTAEYRKKR
ncbi:MAG: NADPH-dependent 7-cyano-7-deazaguanine reductase QueF [Desulfobulbaceae bacterium]|nr:NADPH-dependent 7-cyano-7-deazaguanine reductase QueF [Desulfobulbaceae bacterium]